MRQRKEQGLTLSFYDLEMFASYAKAMEKDQIVNAWDNGCTYVQENSKQYYNETFKTK